MRTSKLSKVLVAFVIAFVAATAVALAAQTDIVGPAGSGQFGKSVSVLPNGNLVVTDPGYDAPGPITDTGAVYLYDGGTGALISRLAGSQANDQVGSGGVVTLTNGNYVVLSPFWANGAVTQTGAVTWGNGTMGITGTVSAANSLVGSHDNDRVGDDVTALTNGNYVVLSPDWNNTNGAATWGNGTTGITGTVSAANSLVGSYYNDKVGDDVTALTNGNYVVLSTWSNGATVGVGAATWGNGATGITGAVSTANSLVGSLANDQVGYLAVALSNGNYVVLSPLWANGLAAQVGAATWGNGVTGITGVVTISNSLVGRNANDLVGTWAIALSNGNYVVESIFWDTAVVADAGAATWGNGLTGITGTVSGANSLVGTTLNDYVGLVVVTALSDGNYAVLSTMWDNGTAANAGAVTLGNGRGGTVGPITNNNSVLGTAAGGGSGLNWGYNPLRGQLVVGRPADNLVTLFGPHHVYLPFVIKP